MSEVEKMYMRCKIKKQQTCRSSDTCYSGSLDRCEGCNSYQYPLFTAEKQLELIKCLANKKLCISSPQAVNTYVDKFWHIGINPFNFKLDMVNELTFEECLAGLVNYLWQDLTTQERTEIRSILNEQ